MIALGEKRCRNNVGKNVGNLFNDDPDLMFNFAEMNVVHCDAEEEVAGGSRWGGDEEEVEEDDIGQ